MVKKRLILLASILFLLTAYAENASQDYPTTGIASWYSTHTTASGEKFNDNDSTCAMRRYDFGKFYKVCNVANGKCVVVRQNDFGPSKYLYDKGRIIDLSKKAFSRIADLEEGIIKVTIEEQD